MKVLAVADSYSALEMLAQVCADLRHHTHRVLLVCANLHHGVPANAPVLAQIDMQLDLGTGSPIAQTAQSLIQLETLMLREKPNWVLIAGDTPVATAAALSASKLHIQVARLGAGERSFERTSADMNRQFTDHLSDILCVSAPTALENLQHEGIPRGIYQLSASDTLPLHMLLEIEHA
jgi:UDP-N-acetylglucosamine 2-epimerase